MRKNRNVWSKAEKNNFFKNWLIPTYREVVLHCNKNDGFYVADKHVKYALKKIIKLKRRMGA